MSVEVLEYLNEKKVISQFEYDFYTDTFRKRVLSEKQLEIRQKINQKLINFTSYESNSAFNRINLVLKWSDANKWFDTTFVESLKQSCERNGKLTEKQFQALENIISKLKIP